MNREETTSEEINAIAVHLYRAMAKIDKIGKNLEAAEPIRQGLNEIRILLREPYLQTRDLVNDLEKVEIGLKLKSEL